jgi:ATP-dependent protease ClpP protease subunit
MERISTDTERDFFLDAKGAVEYGIVDEVLVKTPVGQDGTGANDGGKKNAG